ncbi:polysaccharide deacetylase family protein [Pseudonocardia sp. MH-G8]|uniref:polysaccharide deacetylase family protein n=1 Tax=Pseudonocardia sp. MH-G8 TaxID=1854588 RepID=UPI000BA11B22|nr:polysaccharide deacetylase family protein [Pseudonocardia sp. MH-G8]OZM79367.1 polysaccharide deacetylase [Pseudonocardia sp. MH-G8]
MTHDSGGRLLVIGWHNVEGTWCFPGARGAGLRGLARQLRTLQAVANVVPLAAALADLASGRRLPPRAVAITFDDGYRDNLTLAAPLLRELRLPATCFLVPGLLDRTARAWWEELASAVTNARAPEIVWEERTHSLRTPVEQAVATRALSDRLKQHDCTVRETALDELTGLLDPARGYTVDEHFMDWDEALRLQEHMEIGSHSLRHAILSRESTRQQYLDLWTARRQLQERLGVEAAVLAYPNGTAVDYGPTTLAAAAAAGHAHAVTTRRGVNRPATPRFEVRRTVMDPRRGVRDLRKLVRDILRSSDGPPPAMPSRSAAPQVGSAP